MMKKRIGSALLVLVMVSMLILAGCQSASESTAKAETTGQLKDGMRVIEIEKGFSKADISVNRGEELTIIYSGENAGVSLEVPGYEVENTSESNTVELYVKAKTEGEFELVVTDGKTTENGLLVVKAYQNEATFRSVMPEDFEAAMTGEYFLLDVRTQEEYDDVHIEGATLISVYELENRISEIEQYKDIPVLVYCRSGNRSIVASQILIENGFMNITDLQGGISAWTRYQAGK
ncbi:MAG: rhodanese-like domain-containing protein [Eubacteriales bacterium]